MTVVYRKRLSFFEKAETEWRVEDDALVQRDATGVERRLLWSDLTAVQAGYAPTRMKTQRHILTLSFRGYPLLTIDNEHFAGLGDFEDRSETYVPFAHAVLAKAAATHPALMVRVGATPMSYVLNLLFVGVTFAALIAVLILLPLPLGGWPIATLIKLVLIAAMLPVFFRWIKRARPRLARPDALPDDALPKPGA